MKSYAGHEADVTMAYFTKHDNFMQIISCSADKTIRLWEPKSAVCAQVIKNGQTKQPYHESEILNMTLHPSKPLVISGAADGSVCAANYTTGESFGIIGKH
jgi:WD40 repeat protein